MNNITPPTPQPLARHTALWREPHDAPTFTAGQAAPHVLVVEDDPVQALLLTLMLEHLGVVPTLVTDGSQAIEAVKTHRYAMVLMDYLMPVINGIEATRHIRQWEHDHSRAPTPIVAVTASAMHEERARYIDAGMNAVMLKPFLAHTLAELVSRFCPTPGANAHTLVHP